MAGIREFLAQPTIAKRLRRIAVAAFLILVATLLIHQARTIDWTEVLRAVRNYPTATLSAALVLAALSYLIYSCYDLLGRTYVRAPVTAASAMTVAFVSFAFNQSLGSLIGAIAFRARLYSRLGLGALQISKIITLAVVTNWLGYAMVAGLIFASGWIAIPGRFDVAQDALRYAGVVMLCTAIAYWLVCALWKCREFTVRGRVFKIPGARLASLQLALSIVHWPAAASILYVLFQGRVEFVTVLGGLLLSSVAVVLTHIPAGLGVLEAIFIAILRDRMPTTTILAALLVFRAVYYFAPLAVAALIYFVKEARGASGLSREGERAPLTKIGGARTSPTPRSSKG